MSDKLRGKIAKAIKALEETEMYNRQLLRGVRGQMMPEQYHALSNEDVLELCKEVAQALSEPEGERCECGHDEAEHVHGKGICGTCVNEEKRTLPCMRHTPTKPQAQGEKLQTPDPRDKVVECAKKLVSDGSSDVDAKTYGNLIDLKKALDDLGGR